MTESAKRATVLVLGDLGRSPRMLNHARALAGHGWQVNLVGFAGARLPPDLAESRRVGVTVLADSAGRRPVSPSRVGAPFRQAWRGIALGFGLLRALPPFAPAHAIIVQNPPGIPTLPIAWLMARLSSSRLIVDWHNLTAAMLRLKLPPSHPLVAASGAVERWVGRHADANLFVSSAMAARLGAESHLRGAVLRDRPSAEFAPLGDGARREVRSRMLRDSGLDGDERDWVIVLSPTSWTADEDFDLLLDALRDADAAVERIPASARCARLLVLVSGRGALRERFEQAVAASGLRHLAARTAWFEAAEYPRAVAASDVGLSLHRSASGLDLPMKIMDFFGSGVPVLALDYGPCLAEAVSEDVNGLLFADANALSDVLVRLVTSGRPMVEPLRPGALDAGRLRWDHTWTDVVLPLLS